MQKQLGNKFSDESVGRHSGQTGQHLSNICSFSKLPDKVAQFGQAFTPDAGDIESAATAELTIDNDDCERIEVDW